MIRAKQHGGYKPGGTLWVCCGGARLESTQRCPECGMHGQDAEPDERRTRMRPGMTLPRDRRGRRP